VSELSEILAGLNSVVVGYSGGVDSTFLAYSAHHVLGDRALAVIADSASLPRSELDEALRVAHENGFPVEIVHTDEFQRDEYTRNAPDRCFHCKQALFDQLFPLAQSRGFAHVALGTVTDDLGDVRPGLESARRRGAKQPLLDAGLSKAAVRALAREAGLSVWDKPQAACLSSRIPHGTPVTIEALRMVETAEANLRRLGFSLVRVRHYGETARVEVGADEVSRLIEMRDGATRAVSDAGYRDVVLDERGYRAGGTRLPLLETR
jgi:uncharacterized protein